MLSQTLDWIAAHPVVTGAALVVSLALALIYGAIIYVAIGRMRPDRCGSAYGIGQNGEFFTVNPLRMLKLALAAEGNSFANAPL